MIDSARHCWRMVGQSETVIWSIGETSPLHYLIGQVLLRAKIIRRSFQDVPQHPARERNPETQDFRQYSVDLSKLADGPSSEPECQAGNGEQYPCQPM